MTRGNVFQHKKGKDTTVATAAAANPLPVVTLCHQEEKECANETERSGEEDRILHTNAGAKRVFQKATTRQKVSANFRARNRRMRDAFVRQKSPAREAETKSERPALTSDRRMRTSSPKSKTRDGQEQKNAEQENELTRFREGKRRAGDQTQTHFQQRPTKSTANNKKVNAAEA